MSFATTINVGPYREHVQYLNRQTRMSWGSSDACMHLMFDYSKVKHEHIERSLLTLQCIIFRSSGALQVPLDKNWTAHSFQSINLLPQQDLHARTRAFILKAQW